MVPAYDGMVLFDIDGSFDDEGDTIMGSDQDEMRNLKSAGKEKSNADDSEEKSDKVKQTIVSGGTMRTTTI